MKFKFIFGKKGYGKTQYILNEIKNEMKGFLKFIVYFFAGWIILVGTSYLFGLWFVDKAGEVAKDLEQTYNEVQKEDLELVGKVTMTSSGSFGYYTYYIEGILKNVSGRRLDYAQVSFVIYDT